MISRCLIPYSKDPIEGDRHGLMYPVITDPSSVVQEPTRTYQ